ncbi:MAG: 6-phosphofructokinase [Kiritimatiellae bacterium]|nr:6-phosphofructokinase [Kiritimatiellia bacterium]
MSKEANNFLVAQSGGPSMVINQSLVGAVLAAAEDKRVGAIYGARHGIRGILDGDTIDLRDVSRERLERIAATPSSALGSVRMKPTPEDCARIFARLRELGVRWFLYIGGNDSAETADIIGREAEKAGEELVCFHVPKTIDNDLRENDHTPGFGSAARFVASAFIGDDLDNRALGGVKINIVMGRNAGFLTAASALARRAPGDGPHLIYLPERPFSAKRFADDVMRCIERHGRCVVAVSEGIADENGVLIASQFSNERDSHGNLQLGGSGALGDALASLLKRETGGAVKRVRADTFGYLQRSFPGVASVTDSREARAVGEAAARAALSGKWRSGSVAIRRADAPDGAYGCRYEVVPLSSVAKNTRSMPDAFIAPEGNDVTQAFIDYARPLVGDLPPVETL